ncbi:ABC transporter substrate-binding protein [Roseixanthobacter liquoris]|uniref:ABC transporter substrate-binding protein n=1 Tax=Roseixanthobacter liquoris TaxID=3119921 RepID=UPI00372B37A5
MYKKIIRGGLLALSLAALSTSALAADPIRIGLSGPFTGGSSPMGISMRDAIRMAVAEINAKGGVLGRPLELVERDDEAKNERGVQVAQELIHKEKVVAGLGVINTGVALASARFYQEAKVPLITPGPTGSNLTEQFAPPKNPASYIFRVSLRDKIQVDMIVDEVIKAKLTKVAILADSTNYGQLGREDLVAALKAKNIEPVAIEKFNIKDVDMTPQLLRAKDAGATAVLTYGVGPELAQIANGMAKLGWKVPIIGSWTLSMPNFIESAGVNGEGARMPQTIILADATGKKKTFIDNFSKATGTTRIPGPVWAAQGYDTVYILAAAIQQAGSTDGDKIREALENLNVKVDGLVMTYDKPFSATDHEAFKDSSVAVIGEVKDGQVVYANEADRKKTN